MPVKGICLESVPITLEFPAYKKLIDRLNEEADYLENAILSGQLERNMHQDSIDLMTEAASVIEQLMKEIERR